MEPLTDDSLDGLPDGYFTQPRTSTPNPGSTARPASPTPPRMFGQFFDPLEVDVFSMPIHIRDGSLKMLREYNRVSDEVFNLRLDNLRSNVEDGYDDIEYGLSVATFEMELTDILGSLEAHELEYYLYRKKMLDEDMEKIQRERAYKRKNTDRPRVSLTPWFSVVIHTKPFLREDENGRLGVGFSRVENSR